MSNDAGTLEVLIGELTLLLSPLADLTPQRSHLVLRELGVAITPQQATTLATTCGQITSAIGALIEMGPTLEASVGDQQISVNSLAMSQIQELISGISSFAIAVDALQLPGVTPDDIAALPKRLLGWLIATYLGRSPGVNEFLQIAGILTRTDHNLDSHDPAKQFYTTNSFDFGRIGEWLSNPAGQFAQLYDWGKPTFGPKLLALVDEIVGMLGVPTLYDPTAANAVLDLLFAQLAVHQGAGSERGLEVLLRDGVGKGSFEVGATNFTLTLSTDFEVPGGTALVITPSGMSVSLPDATQPSGKMSVDLVYRRLSARLPLLSMAGGQISVEEVSVTSGLDVRPVGGTLTTAYSVGIAFTGGKVVIDAGAASELLAGLLGVDKVESNFDLALDYSLDRGLRFGANTHLQKRLASDISLGPVTIDALNIDVGIEGGKIPLGVLADLRASVGPLSVMATGLGFVTNLSFPPQSNGNLGPLDIVVGFKAPTGIGLSLDAGPVSGGGFLLLDPAGNRYGGVLQLKLLAVSVTAFGLYELTSAGRASFVAVLGIRFNPGFQLSFGFALQGVGGLVGINRQANVDVLRERLASGASGDVLFCDDPLHKAASLLGDLSMFFPTAPSGFLVGPTLQISWLAPLVRLDVGIVLQFPGPSKILLLGSLRSMIGVDESLALLYVRMDFMGSVDTGAQLIAFDAQLVNSHALGILHLTGGTALRIGYGSPPYSVLTIGGFHPRFDPAPLHLPAIPRVGASLDASFIARVYLRLEMYLALTSNTLQTGAHVQAGMELGPLSASGHFDFDALVQFRPFWFEADFSAGFAVEAFDISFASVDIDGHISGPGPIVIHAGGRVKRLGIKVSGSATFELGDNNKDAPPAVPSVVQALKDELNRSSNLRAAGEDRGVILATGRPATGGVIVLPRGQLIWEQKRVPLKTIIQRFEGVALAGAAHELHVTPASGWTASDEQDWFACGSFAALDLKASQTLNNTTFQQLPSGVQVGVGADKLGANVAYTPSMSLVKKPAIRLGVFAAGAYMSLELTTALRNRGTMSPIDAGLPAVSVSPETFDVHGVNGAATHADQSPFQAFQLSRQKAGSVAVPSADVTVTL
ncbi:hypothetical protein K788_0001811 (plasmid) [Paraburkholderia caribensis MBA4]|uniref:DUF6603 domain-containing protein n=1 Tax=Paraburkholderia caribensis MBA4 TaxID=1323664 RepID=A0A0P0RQX2_9BURK|nr:DUF6603 domain-containing protein [Paraburkholderia caribensis]ALL71390.1 hypothetical protein K788_0001811 [Paraburkholderia caribensis MBA4]